MTILSTLAVSLAGCRHEPQGAVRVVPQIAPAEPRRLDAAPSEQRFLVQEDAGLVGLWDLSSKEHPVLLASMRASATEARFMADGSGVITGSWDGYVRRWGQDGRLVWVSAERHGDRVRCLAVANDLIVSGGEDGALRFWRLDGTAAAAPVAAHETAVMSVAIMPGGDLVTMGGDESIRLWKRTQADPPAYAPTVLYQDPQRQFRQALPNMLRRDPLWGWDRAVAVSPRGDVIAGAVLDGKVRLWRADGSPLGTPWAAHGGRHVRALAFSPRGDALATGGWDGSVRFWNLDGSARGEPVLAHDGPVFGLAFSPDGDYVVTSGNDNRVRALNLNGTARGDIPESYHERVLRVAFAPNDPVVAVAFKRGLEGAVRLWGLDGNARAQHRREHDIRVRSLDFSPRGDVFVTGDQQGNIQIWKSDGNPFRRAFQVHKREVSAVAVSRDGNLIASGARHEPLRLSRLNGQGGNVMTGVGDTMEVIVFAPKGDLVAAGGVPGNVQIWNAKDGTVVTPPFKAHSEGFYSLAFAPPAAYFATSGGGGNAIKLWNIDGTPHGGPLEGHSGMVKSLAFAPNAEVLVSGGEDGVVRLWNVPAGTVDTIDLGVRIDQVGFWRDVLWVRAKETLYFFNHARQIVATVHLRTSGLLAATPDGWFAGTGNAVRVVRAFAENGAALSSDDTARYLAPSRVLAALSEAAK